MRVVILVVALSTSASSAALGADRVVALPTSAGSAALGADRAVALPTSAGAAVLAADRPAADARGAPKDGRPHDDRSRRRTGRWGLVLSGGGARGLAHIGVLQALEERGLEPDVIVGTSMGAIVGSLRASGRTSREIAELLRGLDWASILYPRTDAFSWRGQIVPRPLLQLVVGKRGPQLPTAALDDAFLNHQLSSVLFEASAAAGGDFDDLVVPFRAVATDLATVRPVVLRSGDLARAVRASSSIPLLFPAVPYGNRLLIDGGFSSDLPISVARQMGVDRVIAVDVSEARRSPEGDAPATAVLGHLVDLLMRRGQSDTTQANDLLVRLPMPGYGSTSYSDIDSLIALGYRGSVATLRAFADSVGLEPRASRDRAGRIEFPPPAGTIRWEGLRNLTAAHARAALGRLPAGRFAAAELKPALARLYRSGLFQSAWPGLQPSGDSTVLSFDVIEAPARELDVAAAHGNDEGGRVYARIADRRSVVPYFRLADVVGTRRTHRTTAQLNLERIALGRGGSGAFARVEYVESQTRIFRDGDVVELPVTLRRGAYAGAQVALPAGRVTQLAAGWASIGERSRRWNAPAFVFRTEAQGAVQRTVEGEWVLGPDAFGWAGARFEIAPSFGKLIVRPTLRAAAVSGDPPSDALVGLGGPRTLSGIHDGEWLGRRHAAFDLLLLYPLGAGVSLVASAEAGAVAGAVSATEIPQRLQAAGGLGLDLATPLGPVRVHWGVGPRDRTRVDVMLGERF